MNPSKEALALDAAHRAYREALDTPGERAAYLKLRSVAARVRMRLVPL